MFSELDMNGWSRKATYEFFEGFQDPFFNFTANVDVSSAFRYCKLNDLGISLSFLYCSLVAANDIAEFRIRNVGGRLVEFDQIHATQTILHDDDTFSFAYFEMQKDVFRFNHLGKDAIKKYRALKTFDVEADRSDLIYYSVIPWVSFTSFKHASRLDNSQMIPRVVFGKIFENGERMMMPVSVEANHMIMDGVHVGKFFERFQRSLDSMDAEK